MLITKPLSRVFSTWITPIKVKDLASTTIKLTGMPANARYYSLQTYTLDDQFSSVVGALADVNITMADTGSYTILINDGIWQRYGGSASEFDARLARRVQ